MAKQATCKIKSVIEWIKTVGKKNIPTIERLDKKYRDL